MRLLGLLTVAVFLTGCSSQHVDISSAYWPGRHDPQARDADGWPLWAKAPQKGVKIGQPSIPEADRSEYVGFLWDETGLYGRVFAFEFPQIKIVPSTTERRIVVMATTPAQINRTLGKVGAFVKSNGEYVSLESGGFRTIDRGWVMKPGQCQTEFWLSWKALGGDGPPTGPLAIRVRDRLLSLDTQKRPQ